MVLSFNRLRILTKLIKFDMLSSMVELLNYARNKEEYLNQTGKAEDLIQCINDVIIRHSNPASNAALLEKRAPSRIDLAKKYCNGKI
ncbi:hypothetical protein Holit_02837 [Hollandina sp. SP2]